jgi:putative flippase GtrA
MAAALDRLAQSAWRLVPAPIERKLRTEAGYRFLRFVPVSLAAVITSQLVLAILTGPLLPDQGFTDGVLASIVAAGVSYLLSRWAWERKGKPDLLRETLPFWAVSIACWIILGLTTHYANSWAKSMHIQHLERHLVVNGAYLVMNCITFVCRFLIFHYALFANRGGPPTAGLSAGGPAADRSQPGRHRRHTRATQGAPLNPGKARSRRAGITKPGVAEELAQTGLPYR